MPDSLQLNAIVPFERADRKRPEGAIVAVISSIRST